MVAIFKPDRYSRIYEFKERFGEALSKADIACLCPFPENAVKEPGIDIDVSIIQKYLPSAILIEENEEGIKTLDTFEPAVYLFMSSKDIYKLMNQLIDYQGV